MSKKRTREETEAEEDEWLNRDYEPRGFAEQQNTLLKLFPHLSRGYEELTHPERALPEGAENYFAIPRWKKIAPTYSRAVYMVVTALMMKVGKSNFSCSLWYDFGSKNLRQHRRTATFFKKIGEDQQGADILVVPAQFGHRHECHSSKEAEHLPDTMTSSEFGLDIFAVCVMLLTHPDRIFDVRGMGINCIGNECRPGRENIELNPWVVPYFSFERPLVALYAPDGRRHEGNSRAGAATGFALPEFSVSANS